MVEWLANDVSVTLRKEDGLYVITDPSGSQTARSLDQALAKVRQPLHQLLAGSTGMSGWRLILTFPRIRAPYGDAVPNGGGGGSGSIPDVVRCANGIYDRALSAHPAIENSIDIVKSCWSPTEAAA